jgi:hypothetical protein
MALIYSDEDKTIRCTCSDLIAFNQMYPLRIATLARKRCHVLVQDYRPLLTSEFHWFRIQVGTDFFTSAEKHF